MRVCVCRGSLNLTLSGARPAPACLRALWMRVWQQGGGGGVDALLSLQVSILQACDCRRWCHCGSALPTSYLCLSFLWLSGSWCGWRDWSQCPCGFVSPWSACACGYVFACVDLYDLIIVSLCIACALEGPCVVPL